MTAAVKPAYRVPSMAEVRSIPPNGLTVVSTFSGCGGSCLGFRMAGFSVVWACEFTPEAAASYRANASPATHLDTRDIREVKAQDILEKTWMKPGEIDVLEGSPPCFPAGTTVVTGRGVLPIECVEVGDAVLTHKGRWRAVTATMSRQAETVLIDGGRIEATRDHPVLTRPQERYKTGERYRPDNSHPRGSHVVRWRLGSPGWTPAADVHGRFIAIPARVEALSTPTPADDRLNMTSPDFWWFVGRWLGDGWVREEPGDRDVPWKTRTLLSRLPRDCPVCDEPACRSTRYPHLFGLYCSRRCKQKAARGRRRQPRYEVNVCCSYPEADKLAERLADIGLRWARADMPTAVRFTASSRALVEWLTVNFGKGATGKTLPGWLLGAEPVVREAVLDGYLAADGHRVEDGKWIASSVSRALTVGIRLLATGLSWTTSVGYRATNARAIEGRAVSTRPSWSVQMVRDDGRYTRLDGDHRWVKVRRVTKPGRTTTVYDLTVDEDESFVADGIVVHNCTSFSTAGKREAGWGEARVGGDTGIKQRVDDLFFEYARLLEDLQPRVFVAENVTGLVKGTSKGYFKLILARLRECGYRVEARVLDAQWLGVPQARQRLIFVGVRDDLGRPPAFPRPFPYRHSVRDALPELCAYRFDTSGWYCRDLDVCRDPAPTVTISGGVAPWHHKVAGPEFHGTTIRVPAVPAGATTAPVTERRKFTIAELRRICAFPDDFILTGSYAQQWARLGNAVPPLMMRAVAEAVRDRVLT